MLTNGSGAYTAKVRPLKSAELDDVIERMVQRGSMLLKADIMNVLEEYQTAVETMVLEGTAVSTPLANYSTSIRGLFDGRRDVFDKERHELVARVNAGKRFRESIEKNGEVHKVSVSKRTPAPLEVIDETTGETDTVLTPGKIGRLLGEHLKFDEADQNQGLFIRNNGTTVRVTTIARNMPSELIFEVPETLVPGEHTLEVRAKLYGSNDVRSGELEFPVTVA